MGLGDVFNAVISRLQGGEKVAELKFKKKEQDERYRQYVYNQWNRLFSSDFNVIQFLHQFSEINHWVICPDEFLRFVDDEELYFNDEKYKLFQHHGDDSDDDRVRITPILYDVFQYEYKKAVRDGVIDFSENEE